MSTLVTFPGRFGDLLWALPTVRAISEVRGEPVDLAIAGEFRSIIPLLEQQPYLGRVTAIPAWYLTPPKEWQAPVDDLDQRYWEEIDEIIDLGYRGWPEGDLARYTWAQGKKAVPGIGDAIDLERPWIQVPGPYPPIELAVGFTEAWFELKVGLVISGIEPVDRPYTVLTIPGSRWIREAGYVSRSACTWVEAAGVIRNSDLFVGDCSALHVLAVALGKRCVIVEPMEGRWNEIFYPLGTTGRVRLVLGNDGRPTFDARAVKAAIQEALHGR